MNVARISVGARSSHSLGYKSWDWAPKYFSSTATATVLEEPQGVFRVFHFIQTLYPEVAVCDDVHL